MARNAFIQEDVEKAFDYWNISKPSFRFHSSFHPYLSSTFTEASDSAVPFRFYAFRNFVLSKTFNEKPEKRNWYNIQLHPVIDAEIGYDPLLKNVIPSTAGGIHVKANINNDFTFAATALGGSTSLPFYVDTNLSAQNILPESGQSFRKNKNYLYSDFTGYVSYSPNNNKIFNLQAGRDKHFIGDGYRSILLSDFAPAYPFFRINTNLWRFQYNVWYTWMYDVTTANGMRDQFKNKFGTFHYLSYNITKQFNVAVFENIIWRGTDTNQYRGFDANYLNPMVFYRPQEFSLGSPDNAFLGLNINAKLFSSLKLYGQLGLDEFFLKEIRLRRGWWANKQAWQMGAKYINAFNIKGLDLQFEYNEVRPYTYTHGLVEQNYAHYGYALAHPFGANFRELNAAVSFRKKNWQLNWRGMYVLVGKDSVSKAGSNVGQNIFQSYITRPFEFGHYTTQGIQNTILQSTLRFTYFIIPDMNLRLEMLYIQRAQKNTLGYELQNPYISIGIKSTISNKYRDF